MSILEQLRVAVRANEVEHVLELITTHVDELDELCLSPTLGASSWLFLFLREASAEMIVRLLDLPIADQVINLSDEAKIGLLQPLIYRIEDSDQLTALFKQVGNRIRQLVPDMNAYLQRVDTEGHTAFHSAALFGEVNILRYLIELRMQIPIQPNSAGYYPIHLAATDSSNLETLQYVYSLDPTGMMRLTEAYRRTPFHVAAYYGQVEALRFLFPLDPTVINRQDIHGDTPLILAATSEELPVGEKIEVCTCLLQLGADMSILNSNNRSAVSIARHGVARFLAACGDEIALHSDLTEDYILETRYSIYFSDTLLNRLLFWV